MLATRLFVVKKVEKHWSFTSTRRRNHHLYLNVNALSNVQTAIFNATQQPFSVFYDAVTKEIAVTLLTSATAQTACYMYVQSALY
jgi:hypothetical protein